MRNHFSFFILSGCFLCVKSHIIRVAILAALGLTGLWLLHLLAQDYQHIQNPGKKWLFKRSLNYQLVDYTTQWSDIWSHDPIGCVRSFICQLAANHTTLDDHSTMILDFARSFKEKSQAMEELQDAIQLGQGEKGETACFKMYKYCPFSAHSMLKIMTLFSSSKNTIVKHTSN